MPFLSSLQTLCAYEAFQSRLILNHQRGALHESKLPALEFSQSAGHGLARGPDGLCDLLVSKSQPHANSLPRLLTFVAPVQQETGKLFRRRLGESQGPDLITGSVIAAAQLLGRPDGGFRVFRKEAQEVLPLNEIDLAGLQRLHRELVRPARNGGIQTQNFARADNP